MTKTTVALVIHQNSTKNRGHFGKAETKPHKELLLSIIKIFCWNKTFNFYSHQEKKQFFSTQKINVQHFCVPRNQMPLSQGQNTSFSRKRMSRGGWGRTNLIIHTASLLGIFFFCLHGHIFLITTPNFSFARLASKVSLKSKIGT